MLFLVGFDEQRSRTREPTRVRRMLITQSRRAFIVASFFGPAPLNWTNTTQSLIRHSERD